MAVGGLPKPTASPSRQRSCHSSRDRGHCSRPNTTGGRRRRCNTSNPSRCSVAHGPRSQRHRAVAHLVQSASCNTAGSLGEGRGRWRQAPSKAQRGPTGAQARATIAPNRPSTAARSTHADRAQSSPRSTGPARSKATTRSSGAASRESSGAAAAKASAKSTGPTRARCAGPTCAKACSTGACEATPATCTSASS